MGVAPEPGQDQPQQGLKSGPMPRRISPRMRALSGWIATDARYDYHYAPRIEHFFNGEEIAYCGTVGIWSTDRSLKARRRCLRCTMYMIRDGLLAVTGPRGYW